MCTSLFLWDQHPTLLFLLAFNRDEFLARKTEPAHFWQDWPNLLAGRDEERGGTWLGMTSGGRFAMLTNFREVAYDAVKHAPSRGALTTDFLNGKSQPLQYLEGLKAEAYNGFNLIRDGVAQLHEHSRPAQRPEDDTCPPWVKVSQNFSWV
ncbi:hypothetical protein WJX82_001344 [Trebouxia sp. C0006]